MTSKMTIPRPGRRSKTKWVVPGRIALVVAVAVVTAGCRHGEAADDDLPSVSPSTSPTTSPTTPQSPSTSTPPTQTPTFTPPQPTDLSGP
jgi:hypothetical protein